MTLLRSCLAGGGEAGERLRAVDWSNNPLGPVEGWPISLQSTVRIILGSEFPMMLHWGPHLVTIYNDAYAPSLGNKHPATSDARPGNGGRRCGTSSPRSSTGSSPASRFFVEDARYTPERDGEQREAFFTHCHSRLVWTTRDGSRASSSWSPRRRGASSPNVPWFRPTPSLTDNEKHLAESEAYWRGLFERLNEGFMVVEVVRDAAGVARTWRFAEINEAGSGSPACPARKRLADPSTRSFQVSSGSGSTGTSASRRPGNRKTSGCRLRP